MASLVQSGSYNSTSDGTSHSLTLGSTPVSGNLLIVAANSLTGNPTPSGYSVADRIVTNTDTVIFYKIAGVSESPTVTFTFGAAVPMNIVALEYSGVLASPLDVTANSDSGASSTSVPSGTTAATSQAAEMAVAIFGIVSGGAPAASSYSNGFAEVIQGVTTGSVLANVRLAVVSKTLAATGAQSSTATTASATSNAAGVIATFKLSSTASVAPAAQNTYQRRRAA